MRSVLWCWDRLLALQKRLTPVLLYNWPVMTTCRSGSMLDWHAGECGSDLSGGTCFSGLVILDALCILYNMRQRFSALTWIQIFLSLWIQIYEFTTACNIVQKSFLTKKNHNFALPWFESNMKVIYFYLFYKLKIISCIGSVSTINLQNRSIGTKFSINYSVYVNRLEIKNRAG